MAESSTKTTYVAALGYPTGMAFSPFVTITFEAADDDAAKTHAIEWAMKHTSGIDAKTYLQVKTYDGHGIYSKHMGRQ
jgi:hypothetical protein